MASLWCCSVDQRRSLCEHIRAAHETNLLPTLFGGPVVEPGDLVEDTMSSGAENKDNSNTEEQAAQCAKSEPFRHFCTLELTAYSQPRSVARSRCSKSCPCHNSMSVHRLSLGLMAKSHGIQRSRLCRTTCILPMTPFAPAVLSHWRRRPSPKSMFV